MPPPVPAPEGTKTTPPSPSAQTWRWVVPVLAGVVIALTPAPAGLTAQAWHYFAAFAAVILALITEPMAAAAVGLIGVTFTAVSGLAFTPAQLADPAFKPPAEAVKWALAGFANSTVWLIFAAFVFSMGYEKTGFGRRIALVLVRWLGRRTLGLGYAIALSDLVLAPFTPSNTARSGGTVYPVIRNIPPLYGSLPGETSRRIGAYLMWTAFATTCVTSSMFVTALAPNLFALELVKKATGVEVTWVQWFVGFLPVGVFLVLLVPWLAYKIYPPEIRTSEEVPRWAAQEIEKMGPLSRKEITMAALVLGALGFWIFGANVIDATMVAVAGIAGMLLCQVVTWDDIVANKPAWNVLAWFATMVTMADGLSKAGFVVWVGKGAAGLLTGYSPIVVMTMLVAFFFLIHYMFAGLTAHTTAVLPAVVAAGAAVPGIPLRDFGLLLVFTLGIMGVLTPYACGPAPVFFGSGYIPRKDFWRLAFIFGMIFIVTLLVIGMPWLRVIGR